MFNKIILILSSLLLFNVLPSSSYATQDMEAYEYQKAVITSLSFAKEAASLIKTERPNDSLLEFMKDTRLAQNRLKQAKLSLEDFSKSKNEFISKSQEDFYFVLASIDLHLNQSVVLFEDMLNNEIKEGTFNRKYADLAAGLDEAWKLLMQATIASTNCLIDQNRKIDGKTSYLVISDNQQNELLTDLTKYFGEDVKEGLKAGQFAVDAAAASIWLVLKKQGFKIADEQ